MSKTSKKNQLMAEGGKYLGDIRLKLFNAVVEGATPKDIETLAQSLISKVGEPSFARVPRYKWATCICINEQVVHGIPESNIPFKKGDVVMVDVGLFYKGYHTDCAFSKQIPPTTKKVEDFLQAGRDSLAAGLKTIKSGSFVGEISKAMGDVIINRGYTPAKGLTGHGINTVLHDDPSIPTSYDGDVTHTTRLKEGQTIAVEIIYLEGSTDMYVLPDGWTIVSRDGRISAVFEETVEVTSDGYLILTQPPLFQRS